MTSTENNCGDPELLFDLQRSVRYHERRVAHFDFWHKITNVLTILLSGVVILELTGAESPWWIRATAAVAAVLGAFDLIVGYGHRANQHRDLKRRFCVLERRLISATTKKEVDAIRCDRLEIESEEPPIFRALDTMCYNELLAAHGYSRVDDDEKLHYRKLPLHKRVTAQWIRWVDIAATTH